MTRREGQNPLKRSGLSFLWLNADDTDSDANNTESRSLGAVCRLPECEKIVWRSAGRGRAKWFCDDQHRNAFHQRAQALDRLLSDLEEALSEAPDKRSRLSAQSDLTWARELREQYLPLRTAPDNQRMTHEDDDHSDKISAIVWSALETRRSRSAGPDACPLCGGTGRKWKPIQRWRRQLRDDMSSSELIDFVTGVLMRYAMESDDRRAASVVSSVILKLTDLTR